MKKQCPHCKKMLSNLKKHLEICSLKPISLNISPEKFEEMANKANEEILNNIKELNKTFPGLFPEGLEEEFKEKPYPNKE